GGADRSGAVSFLRADAFLGDAIHLSLDLIDDLLAGKLRVVHDLHRVKGRIFVVGGAGEGPAGIGVIAENGLLALDQLLLEAGAFSTGQQNVRHDQRVVIGRAARRPGPADQHGGGPREVIFVNFVSALGFGRRRKARARGV